MTIPLNTHLKKESSRVLVVNDDRTQLLRISRILEKQNLEVLRFSDGSEVIEYLDQSERADLIITDLHMPQVDGWKLCRLIRSSDYRDYNECPILATSAVFCGEEAVSLAAGVGADAMLRAPFTSAELIRCANQLLGGEVPSIKTNVLIIPPPEKTFRGLAGCFKRFGYEVIEESNPAVAVKHFEVWHPAVVIVWHGHGEDVLEPILSRAKPETQFVANLVMIDEDWEGSQVKYLMAGADACVRTSSEPDYVVSLTEKMSRVRELLRLQDLLEIRTDEVRAQKETLKGLMEGIPDAAIVYERDGTIRAFNDACSKLFCSTAAKLVGRKITDFLEAEELQASMGAGWDEVIVAYYEGSVLTRSGTSLEVQVHHNPIKYKGRWATLAILRESLTGLDAYEPSRGSESIFPIVTESTHDWEFWRSPEGHFLHSSPTCKSITGYDPYEFEMDVDFLQRLAHPEDLQKIPEPTEDVSDDVLEAEFRIIDRNGETRWLAYKSRPVYDDNGNYLGCRGAMRDLTRHKEIENEKERLVAAVEQFTESIAITDLDGRLEYYNAAFETSMLAYNKISLHSVYDMIQAPPIAEAVARGAFWSGRRNRTTRQNIKRVVEVTMSPIRDTQGDIRNLVWSERDITAEVEIQERLMQAQRMEAIGTLAGGVAHDFNNLLSGILGYSSLLKGEPSSWHDVQQAAEVIERAAHRAADLTQKLLGFARQGKHKNESFSVHECIAEVLTLLTRTTDPKITIEGILDATNPWILGDSSQVGQVLLNLAINATHAIENSGRLTIFSRNILPADVPFACESGEAFEEFIEIRVEDTGCGIPQEQLQRIFEPFYTTKEKGSGLGLAMVYGIVQNHGGAVNVESKQGLGTTFTLYFPSHHCGDPGLAQPTKAPEVISGNGRILVIDDEEIVRNIAAKMLTRIGYEVDIMSDGNEAVDYYREHYKEIDLVIVDMMMPRMDGRECFRTLKSINPDVRAILASGYSHNQTVQEIMDEGLIGFIGKPFDFQQIASVVKQAIGTDKKEEEQDAC